METQSEHRGLGTEKVEDILATNNKKKMDLGRSYKMKMRGKQCDDVTAFDKAVWSILTFRRREEK